MKVRGLAVDAVFSLLGGDALGGYDRIVQVVAPFEPGEEEEEAAAAAAAAAADTAPPSPCPRARRARRWAR